MAGDPNWSTVDPAKVTAPGVSGPGIIDALQHGDRDGTVWRPAESDTSIRPGWFYHPAEDTRVKSVEQLANLYLRSVGRNSKLLLNVPPTPQGLLHDTDVQRLVGMHDRLRGWFANSLASDARMLNGSIRELSLGRPSPIGFIRLTEDITRGQHVARYLVEGFDGAQWIELSRGTTIGYAKIDRVTATAAVQRVRFAVDESAGAERPSVRMNVYPTA